MYGWSERDGSSRYFQQFVFVSEPCSVTSMKEVLVGRKGSLSFEKLVTEMGNRLIKFSRSLPLSSVETLFQSVFFAFESKLITEFLRR